MRITFSPEERIFGQSLSSRWLPGSQMIPGSAETLRTLVEDEAKTLQESDRLPRDQSLDFRWAVTFGTSLPKSKIMNCVKQTVDQSTSRNLTIRMISG